MRAIYVDMGTPGSDGERAAASAAAASLGVPLDIVDARGVGRMISVLRHADWVCDECDESVCERGEDRVRECRWFRVEPEEEAYLRRVPVWLSIVSYCAQVAGIRDVFLGYTADHLIGDAMGRVGVEWPAFIRVWDAKADVRMNLPFAEMSELDVVEMGSALGVDYSQTFGCRHEGPVHCGDCLGCCYRKNVLRGPGMGDPTEYRVKE